MKLSARLLRTIFFSTFKIGLFTFGGGLAMIPFIQSEFSEKRDWLTSEEIADITAVAQTLPGVMAVNTSVLTCYRVGGPLAAVVGGIGAVLPSFIVLCIVTFFYSSFIENPYVRGALRGVSGAVTAMFINTLRKMRKTNVADWWAFGFFVVAFAVIFIFDSLNVIFVILAGGLLGFAIFWGIMKKR
ncbi:MAG: chromate transporter [Oscillospiraceae bacterium]|jgi:chromate transporter|nr:chromate transporter [Oscillospiraceae bacterium]